MMKLFLFLGTIFAAGSASASSCVVQTFDAAGTFLAEVQTGDGVALNCAEAQHTAAILNARHNNGINPVLAKVFEK